MMRIVLSLSVVKLKVIALGKKHRRLQIAPRHPNDLGRVQYG